MEQLKENGGKRGSNKKGLSNQKGPSQSNDSSDSEEENWKRRTAMRVSYLITDEYTDTTNNNNNNNNSHKGSDIPTTTATPKTNHCLGINSLLLTNDNDTLLSGGRDATIHGKNNRMAYIIQQPRTYTPPSLIQSFD